MKTKILKYLIILTCFIGLASMSNAQTITCNVTINDQSASGSYVAYCQVYNVYTNVYYTVSSTNPIYFTGSGTQFSIALFFTCSVPLDVDVPTYKVKLHISKVSPLKPITEESGPYTTDDLYATAGISFPVFYLP